MTQYKNGETYVPIEIYQLLQKERDALKDQLSAEKLKQTIELQKPTRVILEFNYAEE